MLPNGDSRLYPSIADRRVLIAPLLLTTHSSTRASEILDGIHPKALQENAPYTNVDDNLPCLSLSRTHYESSLPALTEKEQNRYQYAKALFQVRQYHNASFVLKDYDAPRLRFLRLYAKYLAGEQRKEEQTQDILGRKRP